MKRSIRGHAVAAVFTQPYERARAEGLAPNLSAFSFAVLEAVKKVRAWSDAQAARTPIGYFFENRTDQRGEVEAVMRHMESSPNLRGDFAYSTWGWVPKNFPPAQAGDMLAYEVWKECMNGMLTTPRRFPIRKSLEALTGMVPNFSYYAENTWEAERKKKVR